MTDVFMNERFIGTVDNAKDFMNLPLKRILTAMFAALSVGGCTTPVTPDFTEMSANYAGILEQYQLNSILINIVRASNERPLSFLDIPSIKI